MMTCLQHKPGSWTRSVLNYYEEAILGEFFLKVEFFIGWCVRFRGSGLKSRASKGCDLGVARGFGDGRGQVLQQVAGQGELALPSHGFGFFFSFEFRFFQL